MCNSSSIKKPKKGGSLDTLAQLGVFNKKEVGRVEDFPTLNKATSATDKGILVKRAKRKYIASHMAVGLVSVTEAKREFDVEQAVQNNEDWTAGYKSNQKVTQSYWNMYHCNREMYKDSNGKVTTRYCKNRLCPVCNSIRTAELLNKDKPVLDSWGDDTYMVTLTIENCKGDQLKDVIAEMFLRFVKSKEMLRDRRKRDIKNNSDTIFPKFEGIRKLECTSNRADDYHPHFHVLVNGKECADELVNAWVKQVSKSKIINCKLKGTGRDGKEVYLQDVRKADKGAGNELFKYFTKIISNSKGKRKIFLDRIDVIFRAMAGRRVFQNFGFKIKDYQVEELEQVEEIEEVSEEVEEQNEKYLFDENLGMWHSLETGEALIKYQVSEALQETKKMYVYPSKYRGHLMDLFLLKNSS